MSIYTLLVFSALSNAFQIKNRTLIVSQNEDVSYLISEGQLLKDSYDTIIRQGNSILSIKITWNSYFPVF